MLDAFLDLVFPPRCAACFAPTGSTAAGPFCPVCAEAVDPVPPGCSRCGLPGPVATCGACLADPPAFDSLAAGGLFGGPLADAVYALKYRDRPAVARPLGAWLARRVALPTTAVVVSVPLGRRRRLDRGYDQAALLAAAIARHARLPRLPAALRRTRETPPQVGRTRAARTRNVAGAFAASPRVAGRDVVLVDDVVTTGATADACAVALKASGARSVLVLALGRAEP
jgi:ComF family protein